MLLLLGGAAADVRGAAAAVVGAARGAAAASVSDVDTDLFFSGFETDPDTPVRSAQLGRGCACCRQNVTSDTSEDEGAMPFIKPQRATRPARGRGHGQGGVCRTLQDDSDSDIDESGCTQDPTPPRVFILSPHSQG